MTCPFLEYRDQAGDQSFDHERPYCAAAEQFVQPMRADICNDRYDLHHAEHCEIYMEHAETDGGVDPDDESTEIADGGEQA